MSVCPHCGEKLNGSSRPPRQRTPWWKYEPGPSTNLGCSTLIVIAIVVAVFSSGSKESVSRLQMQVQGLEEKIDGLSGRIDKLLPAGKRVDGAEKPTPAVPPVGGQERGK